MDSCSDTRMNSINRNAATQCCCGVATARAARFSLYRCTRKPHVSIMSKNEYAHFNTTNKNKIYIYIYRERERERQREM